MKNLFYPLLLAMIIIAFIGCEEDEEPTPSITNEVTFAGTTSALTKGFLDDFGANFNGTHDWDVILTTKGISRNGASFSGEGI